MKVCMLSDGIINQFEFEKLKVKTVHFTEAKVCFEFLKNESQAFWKNHPKKDAEANYSFDGSSPWSLNSLLLTGGFDLGFTLLYINDEFYAAGGIRKLDETTTICLSRFFSKFSTKPYGNAFILPVHLNVSRQAGFKKAIVTFNQYNDHLVNYYTRRLPHKKDPISKKAFESIQKFQLTGLKEINYVQQYVFECNFENNEWL